MDMKNCEYWIKRYACKEELKEYFFDGNFMKLRELLFELDCDNKFLFYTINQFNDMVDLYGKHLTPLELVNNTHLNGSNVLFIMLREFKADDTVDPHFIGFDYDEMKDVLKFNIDYLLDLIINNYWDISLCKKYATVIYIINKYKHDDVYDRISEYIKDNVNDDDFKLDDYFIDMIGRDEYEALVEEYKDVDKE